MGIFNFFKKEQPKPKPLKKRYYGANTGNLFASWKTASGNADDLIKKSLTFLRNRARDLERNNAHVERYLELLRSNITGHGFAMQNKSIDTNGTTDSKANELIEACWKKFVSKGNCDVTGLLSFKEILNQIITTVARDGEILIRIVKGYPNYHGIALQLIECDHLDENFNDVNRNIKMSIEYNAWGKPLAYHVFKYHPSDYERKRERLRIKADEIIHLYKKERPSQSRGVTWLHSVMSSLKMYDGFAEASLVEKRLTASKMGFYKRPKDEDYSGDDTDDENNVINEASPGQFEILPEDWGFESFDPKSGNDNFVDFGKAILRNIASGLNISYNSLANDLEGVNFSSIRAGLIEERDYYKAQQLWLVEHFLKPFFTQWLEIQLLKQTIPLPFSKLEKFDKPMFPGKSWAWVDPQKDAKANEIALSNNFKTLTQVLNEQGLDLEEQYQQLAKEKELRKKYGITTMSEATLLQTLANTKQEVQTKEQQ